LLEAVKPSLANGETDCLDRAGGASHADRAVWGATTVLEPEASSFRVFSPPVWSGWFSRDLRAGVILHVESSLDDPSLDDPVPGPQNQVRQIINN
jgi:hypothetical protein